MKEFMTQEERRYIREKHKLPFSFLIFSRLFVFIFPLSMVSYLASSKIFKTAIAESESQRILALIVLTVAAFLLIIFIIHRIESERKFKTHILPENGLFTLKEKLESLNWITIYESKKDMLQFLIKKPWFSGGEIVTIMKGQGDKILINTQPLGKQPFTFFSERANFRKIEQVLKN